MPGAASSSAICHDDADRRRFVETLAEACAKTAWQVHAYGLRPNHFHLVVETPQPNLVTGMKWFLGTYTEFPGTARQGGRCSSNGWRKGGGPRTSRKSGHDVGVDCGALADGEREHVEEHAAIGQ